MGKGSSPPPPDYEAAAKATSEGNLEVAQYTTQANRVDQYSPWGSSTWSKTGGKTFDQAGYDAALAAYHQKKADWQAQTYRTNEDGGQVYNYYGPPPDAPNREDFESINPEQWTQTTSLTPELQAALDSQINMQKNRSQYADAMLDRVKNSYAEDFQAPEMDDYMKDVQGLDQSQLNSVDYTGRVPSLDYNAPELAAYLKNVPDLDYSTPEAAQHFAGVQAVDQNAPVLDTEARKRYEQAAFDSADALLSRKYGRDEQSLRDSLALQGLNPMSQASQQATGSFYDSKNAAYNQLANQSILAGNQMANADYASQLAGFGATNAARGQAFSQANQGYANALQQYAASNAVRQQGMTNALNNYGAALQGYGAQNATRQQGIANAFTSLGADMASKTAANAARNQAYANALNKWQSAYMEAKTKRDMPLNEMNALLTGQQVQMPQFPGYTTQANVQGADILGATNAQYGNQVSMWNADQAARSQTTGSAVGAAATMAAAYFL